MKKENLAEDYDFYDDGTFYHSRKTAHSSFEEPSVTYDDLSRFYGIDLEKKLSMAREWIRRTKR